METIFLNGAELTDRSKALELLGRVLDLPEWWGKNLDALYDCMTSLGYPLRLKLLNREAAEASDFGRRLLRVMDDASEENPLLMLEY